MPNLIVKKPDEEETNSIEDIHMKSNRSSVSSRASVEFPSRASMSSNLRESRIRHIHGLRLPAGKCNCAILKIER